MGMEWLTSVMAIILGTLTASATIGGVLMYRQLGELRIELRHLAEALERISVAATDDRMAFTQGHEALHNRMAAIEKTLVNGATKHKRRT